MFVFFGFFGLTFGQKMADQWHGSSLSDAVAAGEAMADAVQGGGKLYPWSGRVSPLSFIFWNSVNQMMNFILIKIEGFYT